MSILKGRGGQKWLENKISDEEFMQGLSQEFASLPNAQGRFYYPGQRSAMTPQKIKASLAKVKGVGILKMNLLGLCNQFLLLQRLDQWETGKKML
jgi:hypothetical protein